MKKRSLYILQICQSISWGTEERMCFKDSLLLKNAGHEVFLCCIKDSPIDHYAKQAGIYCLNMNLKSMGLFALGQLAPLKNKIKNFEIQIVHNYSFDQVGAMCFMLRDLSSIPLVSSHYSYPRKLFRLPFYSRLAGRIDKVFCSSHDMAEDISLILKVPKHRFEEMSFCYSLGNYLGTFQKKANEFQIGINIDWDEFSEEVFGHFFEAISILNNNIAKKTTILEIFAPRQWESHILYKDLRDLAQKNKVENWVRFQESQNHIYCPADIDLWLSFHGEDPKDKGPIEDINDQIIEALGQNIPVLMARNGGSMELCNALKEKVEVYRPYEARDLGLKIARIQSSYEKYKNEEGEEYIKTHFSPENHLYRLVSSYNRLIAKRENFNRRKALS